MKKKKEFPLTANPLLSILLDKPEKIKAVASSKQNTHEDALHVHRRLASIKSEAPSAKRQAPSAKRQAPSAKRQAPSAKRCNFLFS